RIFMKTEEVYAICMKEDERAIGCIQLKTGASSDMLENERQAELGYWLGVPFWGKGIMSEAVREMLRHAFEDLDLEKVWAGYYEGNIRSKKVQERCGFRYMWTTEDLDVPLMHEKRTGHANCLTKEEWLKNK
ncbi:MAG: GNAT family N-acetyltransferase, partial [Erysipelotrichaceae bacterium]|nr:GNAT family N-acetyltransferase [Erysipelotrichaceae bacterium]